MRYYIRHDATADISGPFTIEELIDAIHAGRIAPDSLASGDLGESMANLRTWRRCDWFPLAAIPDMQHIVPSLPQPPGKPFQQSPVSTLSLCCTWIVTVVASIILIENIQWPWVRYIFLIPWAWSAVYETLRFVKQRKSGIVSG